MSRVLGKNPLLGKQSTTLSAFKRPFCLSPILIVPILKLGASIKLLELLPIIKSIYCKDAKAAGCS